MITRPRRCAPILCALILFIGVPWLGCEQRRREARSAAGGMVEVLRPVALPDLQGLPEAVQEQLERHHERLLTYASDPRADRSSLGAVNGTVGQLLLAYGLNSAAEPALLNAADMLPNDVRWPYYLGYLYKGSGDMDGAALHLERAIAIDSDAAPARVHLAEVYIELDRLADAIRLLEETIRIDPGSAAAHFLLGHIAGPDDPSQAITHYEAALRLQPGASVIHYPLSQAYQRQGDIERSREHLAKRGDTYIGTSDPLLEELQRIRRGSETKLVQGSRLMRERQYQDAAVIFEQVVADDSTNVSAYLNLGVAYAQLGSPQRAIQALQRALGVDPSNSRAHYNLGILLRGRGEEEKAVEHLLAAVDSDPDNSNAHLALAKLLRTQRRCEEAIAHFAYFLTASPGHVGARISQAVCHVQLGEYAEAWQLLETGYEAFPQEPELQDAMIRVLAASPDARVRDGERAVEMAERLAAVAPRPETAASLAMAYAEVGRYSEAVLYQRQAIRAAEQQGLTAILDHLRSNLRSYEAGKPCRTPWPPSVFDR